VFLRTSNVHPPSARGKTTGESGYVKSLRLTLSLMLACVVSACTGTKSPTAPAATTPPVATTLTTPAADSPGDGAHLDNVRPTLTVVNSTSSQSGARTYEFQIAVNPECAANANTATQEVCHCPRG